MNRKYSNKIFLFLISILIIISLAIISCDDTQTIEDIDKKAIPVTNVSFSQHIYPVLNVKCNYSGCHNDESRAGGVSLTTWSNVTDPRIVVKGDPSTSILVWSIDRRTGAKLMPPDGYPGLTEAQRIGIKTWIQEGALNN